MARLRGLGKYWWRHRRRWALSLGSAVLAVATSLAVPRLLGLTIDDLRGGGTNLHAYLAALLAFATVSALLFIVTRRVGGTASRTLAYELRRDLFHRLTELEPAYFHRTRTGDLMNRFTADLQAVQELLGFGSVQAVNTLVTLTLSLFFMLRLSPTLGLGVLALFPAVVLLLVLLLRVQARRYAAVQEQQSTVASKAQENFSGVRVVKGYAMEAREVRDYLALNLEYRRRALALARVEGPVWATVGLLMGLTFVGVLWVGGRLLLQAEDPRFGGLTLGGFISFSAYLFQLSWPLLSIGILSNVLQRGVVSWGRLREVLEERPGICSPPLPALPEVCRGRVTFERVSLTLDGRPLLQDIDLDIPAGRTIGITGRTGSGKSLLGALVPRLLEPTSGRVLVDGRDVREWPLHTLREQIAMVSQEPFLFSATLAENVGFGLPEATQAPAAPLPAERLDWAASVAGLEADLEAMPEGLGTVIGERGITLSGGQRQRTALARAVAKRPRILILDDALSAVDTETEALILGRLKEVLAGRTVFLMGHRVSTLRHADEIWVLEEGRVVERGTHDALLARGGRYAELDRKQRLERALRTEAGAIVEAQPGGSGA